MNDRKNNTVLDQEDGRALFLTPEEIAADDVYTQEWLENHADEVEEADPLLDDLFEVDGLNEALRASLKDVNNIKIGDFVIVSDPYNNSHVHKHRAMLVCAKFGKYISGFLCTTQQPVERYDDFYLEIPNYTTMGLIQKTYLNIEKLARISQGGIMQVAGKDTVLGHASSELKDALLERFIKLKFLDSHLAALNYTLDELIGETNNI